MDPRNAACGWSTTSCRTSPGASCPTAASTPCSGPPYPGLDDTTWGTDEFLLAQAEQRHVLMTRFADTLLGDAIDADARVGPVGRRARDRRSPTTAATSARASSAATSARRTSPRSPASRSSSRSPGQAEGEVSDAFVTSLDVVPTVAEELGIDTDWEFDGLPVDEPRDRRPPRAAQRPATPSWSARRRRSTSRSASTRPGRAHRAPARRLWPTAGPAPGSRGPPAHRADARGRRRLARLPQQRAAVRGRSIRTPGCCPSTSPGRPRTCPPAPT